MKTRLDWYKRPDLVTALDTFLKSEAGQFALEVARNDVPVLPRGVLIDAVTANIELGRVNGHTAALDLFESLRREPEAKSRELKPDWGTEPEEAK